MTNNFSPGFKRAVKNFSYFLASGSHIDLQGIDYISLYGEEPSAIEQTWAIYFNVLELDEHGEPTNAKYAEKRACSYLRKYCDPNYKVIPEFEDWETKLY